MASMVLNEAKSPRGNGTISTIHVRIGNKKDIGNDYNSFQTIKEIKISAL